MNLGGLPVMASAHLFDFVSTFFLKQNGKTRARHRTFGWKLSITQLAHVGQALIKTTNFLVCSKPTVYVMTNFRGASEFFEKIIYRKQAEESSIGFWFEGLEDQLKLPKKLFLIYINFLHIKLKTILRNGLSIVSSK